MKKLTLLFAFLLLISCSACTLQKDQKNFDALHEAFLDRGTGVEGYEVSEKETLEGFQWFRVQICLNTDDAVKLDDYMWFEADVMLFDTDEGADEAYRENQQSGLGGICKQYGRVLIYWMENDPFEDLYQEVIGTVFE